MLLLEEEGIVYSSILLSHLDEKCGRSDSFRSTVRFVSDCLCAIRQDTDTLKMTNSQ